MERLDELSKLLAESVSRRESLRSIGVVGGVGTSARHRRRSVTRGHAVHAHRGGRFATQ